MKKTASFLIVVLSYSLFFLTVTHAESSSFKKKTTEELTKLCYQVPDDLVFRSFADQEMHYKACTALVNRSDDRYGHAIQYLWVMSETGKVNPVTKNKRDLFNYVQTQAENENPDALALMGIFYQRKQFVERDYELAKSYYEHAFSLHRQMDGEPFYYYLSMLGLLYKENRVKADNGSENIDKTREYYEFCAAKEIIDCKKMLAWFYKNGEAGYPQDIKRAVRIMKELAEKHQALGPIQSLIEWHMNNDYAIYDPQVARYWYCRLPESAMKLLVDYQFPELEDVCE